MSWTVFTSVSICLVYHTDGLVVANGRTGYQLRLCVVNSAYQPVCESFQIYSRGVLMTLILCGLNFFRHLFQHCYFHDCL